MQIPFDGTYAEQLKFILERLAVLNEDYTAMSSNIAVIQTQIQFLSDKVEWLFKTFVGMIIGFAIFGATQLWQIVIMTRNGKNCKNGNGEIK